MDRGETIGTSIPQRLFVLVVDQDESWARQVAEGLDASGVCVTLAVSSIARALAIVQNFRMHVIICDEQLSDGCGHEVLAQLRDESIDKTTTILLKAPHPTGCPTDGFDAAIPKPSEVHELRAAVAFLLRRPI